MSFNEIHYMKESLVLLIYLPNDTLNVSVVRNLQLFTKNHVNKILKAVVTIHCIMSTIID